MGLIALLLLRLMYGKLNHYVIKTKMIRLMLFFLDFSKAFDNVSHQYLFHKLYHYGIRVKLLDWMQHFLLQRSQHVIVEGQESDPSTVTSGIPQSTVLAPLLFLCFIYLPNGILSKIKLYADDVLLFATIHSEQDCQQLQRDLDSLGKWADEWKMVFNPKKCEFLRITNKKTSNSKPI